jgi:hypothetical protein
MSLMNLQHKCGCHADGAFGPGTFKTAAVFYKLSPHRAAHFFAQTAHESGNFKAFSENLNYSAKGLRSIFGKYFPTDALARAYERKPEKIANRVYANRMGNGDEASGEGGNIVVGGRSSSPGRTTTAHSASTSGANKRFWTTQTLWLPNLALKAPCGSLTQTSSGAFAIRASTTLQSCSSPSASTAERTVSMIVN